MARTSTKLAAKPNGVSAPLKGAVEKKKVGFLAARKLAQAKVNGVDAAQRSVGPFTPTKKQLDTLKWYGSPTEAVMQAASQGRAQFNAFFAAAKASFLQYKLEHGNQEPLTGPAMGSS